MNEALTDLLMRRLAATEAEEVSLPHILVTCDLLTGVVTYCGPFVTAIDALRAADIERARQQDHCGPDWGVSVTVAPLFEPDALPEQH